jgi:hypothetical protein
MVKVVTDSCSDITPVSPVVGTHVGPHVLAVAVPEAEIESDRH